MTNILSEYVPTLVVSFFSPVLTAAEGAAAVGGLHRSNRSGSISDYIEGVQASGSVASQAKSGSIEAGGNQTERKQRVQVRLDVRQCAL